MKKIELIIPESKLKDAHAILINVNSGGMSYYTVEGSGRVKAEEIIVGRGTVETQPEYIPRTKIEVIVKDDQVEQLVSCLLIDWVANWEEKYLFRIFPLL
jgi:nitrogen regulatory protein P-II 1